MSLSNLTRRRAAPCRRALRPLVVALAAVATAIPAAAGTLTVTTVDDSGPGSLRAAITEANGMTGSPHRIVFAIPVALCPDCVCEIELASPLPVITSGLTVDGTTQPCITSDPVCASASTPSRMRVQVTASSPAQNVLTIGTEQPCTVRGLAIGNGIGITVNQPGAHRIACNHIGVDARGAATLPLSGYGVVLPSASRGVVVGTDGDGVDDLAERNVIIGSAGVKVSGGRDNVIAGNFFGLSADGQQVLMNNICLSFTGGASDNRVGSNWDGTSDALERNVFGAGAKGVEADYVDPDGGTNWVVGNWFGLDATGAEGALTTGVWLGGGGHQLVLQANWLTDCLFAITVEDDATVGPGSTDNCIAGNTYGVHHRGRADGVDLRGNWWGAADGPGGEGPGSGDVVHLLSSGSVAFEPWLVHEGFGCQPHLLADGFEDGTTSGWSFTSP